MAAAVIPGEREWKFARGKGTQVQRNKLGSLPLALLSQRSAGNDKIDLIQLGRALHER